MKKRLFITFLLVATFSFVSFAQTTPEGPGGKEEGSGDVPVPVLRHGPTYPIVPHDVVFFSTYLTGEVSFYGNTVEIEFSQPLRLSSVTLTNLSDGRTNCTFFNGITTKHVVVPSLSYNGVWDICVTSGNVIYHASITVDCYQSFQVSPMN